MTVFRSESANLRVTFPPEQFGMGDGVEQFYDTQGNTTSKRMPWQSAKFDMGMYSTESEGEISRLRQHPSIDDLFWEEREADTAALDTFGVTQGASAPPEGVTAEDRGRLEVLAAIAAKSLSEDKKVWALEEILWVDQRFNVTGFIAPSEERKAKVVRASLMTVLDILDEAGVWHEPRTGDTGAGAGSDG